MILFLKYCIVLGMAIAIDFNELDVLLQAGVPRNQHSSLLRLPEHVKSISSSKEKNTD